MDLLDEYTNYLDEIEVDLLKKTLPRATRQELRFKRLSIMAFRRHEEQIQRLIKHDVIGWAILYPRLAWLLSGVTVIFLFFFSVFSPWIWMYRKPLVQFLWFKISGHNVPLDAIP